MGSIGTLERNWIFFPHILAIVIETFQLRMTTEEE